MARFEVDVEGGRLVGEDSGKGAAIVFLHAGVADRRSWRPLIERLEGSFRLVAYDRRGFGDTSYEPRPHMAIGDLGAVLCALGIERAILVGNSQGGRVAIDFSLVEPARVVALVLIAPAISGAPARPPDSEPIRALIGELEAAEAGEDLELVNAIEAHFWLDGPLQVRGRVGGAARELVLDMNRRALTAGPTGETPPQAAYDRLHSLALPILALAGSLDLPGVIERTQHLVDVAANATFELVDGVAHLPQLEDPDLLASRIRNFALATQSSQLEGG